MSEVTERIDERLKEMGKTKAEFYKDCGITSAAYSQWNTGKTEPKAANLQRIASYLSVNYEWLVHGTGQKQGLKLAPFVIDVELDVEGFLRAMEEQAKDLSPEGRDRLLRMARYFVHEEEEEQKKEQEEQKEQKNKES